MGAGSKKTGKILLIAIIVLGISVLHYGTQITQHHYHIFYREIYFLPIILAGFWFGLRGAVCTSLAISAAYLPFIVRHWQGFSPDDFNKVMEVALYNIVALILGMLKDRETAEHRRMLESESLAAMGRAVSGVAHDMKTPLIAIGGFTRLVQKNLLSEDPSYAKLDVVIKETRRLEDMVRDMLSFSKPLQLNRTEGDVRRVIEQSLAVVEQRAGEKKVQVQTELSAELPAVSIDPGRMEQVFVNLLMNAIQASPEGATVTVRSRPEDDRVMIEFIDCGCGVADDVSGRIYDPFFTTKKEGTGLGLAIVKKIVQAHQATLEFTNNQGEGATFRVVLPLSGGKNEINRPNQRNS